MRNVWHQLGVLRVLLPLIVGILLWMLADAWLSEFQSELFWFSAALLVASLIWVVAYGYLSISQQYKWRIVNGAGLTILVIAFGYLLSFQYAGKNKPFHFQEFLEDDVSVIARISEAPVEKAKTFSVVTSVRSVTNGDKSQAAHGKLVVSFPKDDNSRALKFGDIVWLNAAIREFEEPKNPAEFDYKTFQARHNIYHRCYANSGSWRVVERGKGNVLLAAVYSLREKFLSVIEEHVKNKNDFAVASALMLGYRDYMNDELMQAYSGAGVLHVLSVSGLHVAIMFFMLNFLLQWMEKRGRKFVIAKAAIIILFIWFYACLTGFSPSVLRAAVMFTMIQLGTVWFRHISIYNILAGSALLLLLFNPFMIADVGFLLSYLAIVGIVYLQPKIAGLIIIGSIEKPKFKKAKWYLKPVYFLRYDLRWFAFPFLPDFAWQLTAVSIAAQITTLPLSLYYFHQFPNLFVISNLVVIPLSNLLLFSGTLLFAVSKIPFVGAFVGWVFSQLLWLMNKFTFWVEQIPYSLINGISIGLAEVIVIYLIIGLGFWLLEERRTKVVVLTMLLTGLLFMYNAWEAVQQNRQKKLVVYSIPRHNAIAVFDGCNAFTQFDSTLSADEKSLRYHIKPYLGQCGIKTEKSLAGRKLDFGSIMESNVGRLLVIDKPVLANYGFENKLKIDVVVIQRSARIEVATIKKMFDFSEVVFDGSNKPKQIAAWKKECDALAINYWDVNEKGAFIKNFN